VYHDQHETRHDLAVLWITEDGTLPGTEIFKVGLLRVHDNWLRSVTFVELATCDTSVSNERHHAASLAMACKMAVHL
jgi:hypothetical protein